MTSRSDLYRGRVVLLAGSFAVIGIDGYGLTVFEAFNSDDFEPDDEIEGTLRSQGVQNIRSLRTARLARGCVEITDGESASVREFLRNQGLGVE